MREGIFLYFCFYSSSSLSIIKESRVWFFFIDSKLIVVFNILIKKPTVLYGLAGVPSQET